MNNTIETWRTISEYPKYQVSNMGRVMNMKTHRIMKGTVCKGYNIFYLSKQKNFYFSNKYFFKYYY